MTAGAEGEQDVTLEALRKSTTRIMRQYIGKVPPPEKPSAALAKSLSTTSASKIVAADGVSGMMTAPTRDYADAFAPNPLYAALLQKLNPPHPSSAPLGQPITSLPVPTLSRRAAPDVGRMEDGMLMRRDLTEGLEKSPLQQTTTAGPVRGTTTSGQTRRLRSARGAAVGSRSVDSTMARLPLPVGERVVRLSEPTNHTVGSGKVGVISPLLPPQAGFMASEAALYEQRLREVMERRDVPLGLGLGRSVDGSLLGARSHGGGAPRIAYSAHYGSAHGSGAGSAHVGAGDLYTRSATAPSWAQHKYE